MYKLKESDYFGLKQFFSGQDDALKYRTIEFTTLLIIKRDDFLAVLKYYPQDLEKFKMVNFLFLIYRLKIV